MALVFLVVVAIFAVLFLSLLPVVLSTARKRRMLRSMPGMRETPILGHALYYMGKKPHEIVETVWEAFGKCGNTWKMFLLHEVQVVTSDPKVCEVSGTNAESRRTLELWTVVYTFLFALR